MTFGVRHGFLLQCATHICVVNGAALRYATTLANISETALAAREALRADLDSQITSGGNFEAYMKACDQSQDSDKAINRIGMTTHHKEKRKDHQYYRDTWCAIRFLGEGARSIVDVGSSFPPFLLSTDWIPEREITSKSFVANERPCGKSSHCMLQDGIQANIQDFYAWQPKKVYDIALAMQVVEHVANPARFMRKILKTGRTVVLTAPYRWEDNHSKHKQHKISLEDMRKWASKHEEHLYVFQDDSKGHSSPRVLMVFKGDVEN